MKMNKIQKVKESFDRIKEFVKSLPEYYETFRGEEPRIKDDLEEVDRLLRELTK